MDQEQKSLKDLLVNDADINQFSLFFSNNSSKQLSDFIAFPVLNLDASVSSKIPLALPYSVCLFNKKYFWETHEVLEDLWMNEYGPSREFLQGLIQAAASLYHVIGQNKEGYKRLRQLSEQKLSNYQSPYLGIDFSEIVKSYEVFDQQIEQNKKFELQHLPKITFGGCEL